MTVTNELHATGSTYDLHVFENADGWQVVGYCGCSDIDSIWCDLTGATFEDIDSEVLHIIAEEIADGNV